MVESHAGSAPIPVLLISRLIFVLFVTLQSIAGVSLYVLSTRTNEFFSWTIRALLYLLLYILLLLASRGSGAPSRATSSASGSTSGCSSLPSH